MYHRINSNALQTGSGRATKPDSSAKVDAPEIMKVTGINRVSSVWSLQGLARRAMVGVGAQMFILERRWKMNYCRSAS